MKNKILFLLGVILFLSGSFLNCKREVASDKAVEDSFTVLCAPDLVELTNGWARIFCKINPDVTIEVSSVMEYPDPENPENIKYLGFMNDESDMTGFGHSPWKKVVGRDVMVAVVNSANPFLEEVNQQGISPEELYNLLDNSELTSWGTILNSGHSVGVNLYVMNHLKGSTGKDGLSVLNGKDLISAVQTDIHSIGICKLANVIDQNTKDIYGQIELLPIDKNGNGQIDYKEDIYDDLSTFSRGVWIGKYPDVLSKNIYSVSSSKPSNRYELAFLKWIFSDGQILIDNYGYSIIEPNERLANIRLIDSYGYSEPVNIEYASPKESLFFNIYFLTFLFLVVGAGFILLTWFQHRKTEKQSTLERLTVSRQVLNEQFIDSPKGLFYDKTHTWAFMEKDGMVKIGIDDFLQRITGPLTRIKMKFPGEKIKKGNQILSIIQDGKQLDISAPVTGIIREQNEILTSNTSVINTSPYVEGWVYKIEPTNWLKEIQFMIAGDRYREWLKTEFSRLKEFLGTAIRPETVEYAHVLQDGGELKDRVLEDLGPEVWEDFQMNFIDVSS